LSRGMPENSGVSTLSTAAPRYSSISARYILPRQGTDLVNKIFCNGIAMSGWWKPYLPGHQTTGELYISGVWPTVQNRKG
jgi:hypothetical protein